MRTSALETLVGAALIIASIWNILQRIGDYRAIAENPDLLSGSSSTASAINQASVIGVVGASVLLALGIGVLLKSRIPLAIAGVAAIVYQAVMTWADWAVHDLTTVELLSGAIIPLLLAVILVLAYRSKHMQGEFS